MLSLYFQALLWYQSNLKVPSSTRVRTPVQVRGGVPGIFYFGFRLWFHDRSLCLSFVVRLWIVCGCMIVVVVHCLMVDGCVVHRGSSLFVVCRGGSSLFVVLRCGSSFIVVLMRCRVIVVFIVRDSSLFVVVRSEI